MARILITFLCIFSASIAQSAEWAAELQSGSRVPSISAADQDGRTWNSENLSGTNGYALFFLRSTVW